MHRRNRASLEGIIEDEDLGIEALHPGGVTLSREFAGQLALRNRAQVLEVASGTGETACMLASEFGARVTCLDLSAHLLLRARRPEFRRYPLYRLANDQKLVQNGGLGLGVREEIGFLRRSLELDREARGLENIQEMRVIARQSRAPRFPGSPWAESNWNSARWRAARRDPPCARQCRKAPPPSRRGSTDSSLRPGQMLPASQVVVRTEIVAQRRSEHAEFGDLPPAAELIELLCRNGDLCPHVILLSPVPHNRLSRAAPRDRAMVFGDGGSSVLETGSRSDRGGPAGAGADPHRSHREVLAEEAASEGMHPGEGHGVPALHLPAHLPHALGGAHGPLHLGLPRRAQRFLDDASLRPPAGTHGQRGHRTRPDQQQAHARQRRTRAGCRAPRREKSTGRIAGGPGWAQNWAQ